MSGFGTGSSEAGQAQLVVGYGVGTPLNNLLMATEIEPGSSPGYELCKLIYTYHPLGAKIAEAPINMAQSQRREIKVAGGPEEKLTEAFNAEWERLGEIGADALAHNTLKLSRIYGISALAAGVPDADLAEPLTDDQMRSPDLYFNAFDPLNVAGSLVLDQNPNSSAFLKPKHVKVGNVAYHASRTCVVMNEQPIYIEWTNSAFGYVGRSAYQRALFPLKSFVQTMVTDHLIAQKSGVIVAKMKAPGSIIDNLMSSVFGARRNMIQVSMTNNVLSIGNEDAIESLDLKNLEAPYALARNNILKNIGASCNMPARMLDQETMVSGFGEGEEDAKAIATYIDRVRLEMQPIYTFLDRIVMRRAWNPDFYETIQATHPEQFGNVPYETAFADWSRSFRAVWPNLLTEPESERIKVDDVKFKAVVAMVEVMAGQLDPENRAALLMWAADNMNDRKALFTKPLVMDQAALEEYTPPVAMAEPKPTPETRAS